MTLGGQIEAWYLGDRTALLEAYPQARQDVLARYVQDAVCDTWETLADAIHRGGRMALERGGFPAEGAAKHEGASRIAPLMDPNANASPSFRKFNDALVRLTAVPQAFGGA